MNIQNQLLEFAEKHSLKEKALAAIDKVMDSSIESDNEIGLDFLNGNDRADLIYQFGKFEFQIDKNANCKIVTKINIYSKKLYSPNYDVPVGYYEEWTDLNGEYWDSFLIFDWSPVDLNMDYYIERINKTVPPRYFRRNVPEYEFATYVNHILSRFQGRQFDSAMVFVKRCLDFLERNRHTKIEKEYLNECLELFEGIYHFLKKDHWVETEMSDTYRINERIQNEKLIL